MDLLEKALTNGYEYMYIPGVTNFDEDSHGVVDNQYHRFNDEYGTLDVTVFYHGVFFKKNKFSPSGVSIGSSQYISYNFAALSDAIGGFSGKTIEIEFIDNLPPTNFN